MSNSYIEKDTDLRRYGKDPNNYKLEILKIMVVLTNSCIIMGILMRI